MQGVLVRREEGAGTRWERWLLPLLLVGCAPGVGLDDVGGSRDGGRSEVFDSGRLDVGAADTDAGAVEDASTLLDAISIPDAPPAPACTPTVDWTDLSLTIVGGGELVWDHSNQREPYNIPDSRIAAYRTADGSAHLMITDLENYRISGATLETLVPAPTETFSSFDSATAAYGDYSYREWVTSPYSLDGRTFYALAHSEWYGCLEHPGDPLRACGVGQNQINSWVNAITLFVSVDGGATWARQGSGAEHVVASVEGPYPSWPYWSSPTSLNHGFFHPSTILRQGEYWYAFVRYQRRDPAGTPTAAGQLLLRTRDLARAEGWEAWNGSGYGPIREPLTPLPGTASLDHVGVTWNTALCRYLMVVFDYRDSRLYATSFDSLDAPVLAPLVPIQHQETYQTIPGARPGFVAGNYANLLDPAWPGYNIDGSGAEPYLYYASFDPMHVFSRSVFRARLRVSNDPFVIPEGYFMVGTAIYYSNGTRYCVFADWSSFMSQTGLGEAEVATFPRYTVRPDMPYDGVCTG